MKAFPTAVDNGHSGNQDGMDLRDYFAAKAMQGLIPQYRDMFLDDTLSDWEEEAIPMITEEAYYMADWMMKARGMKHGKITVECLTRQEDNSHEVIADALAKLKEENNHNACGDPHCGICV
jgi:hypothetical protein